MRGLLERHRHAVAAALLVILTVLAYGPVLRDGFIWDDNYQIIRNPFLHSDAPLKLVFTSDVWGYNRPGQRGLSNYYRPLQMLTYRWTWALAGLNAASFHAVNLVFHLLATLAAYAIFWRLSRRWWLSMAAAILFALHPMHTEAVIWIAALTELGCALFYFLAFYCFLVACDLPANEVETNQPLDRRALRKRRRASTAQQPQRAHINRRWWWALSLVSFAVALLWKEMALTLPVVVAAACIFLMPRSAAWMGRIRVAILMSAPYWAVTLLYILVRVKVLGFFLRVENPWQMSTAGYILSTIVLVGEYWLKLLVPMGLNAFHAFTPTQSPFDLPALIAIIFLVVLITLIFFGLRRRPTESFLAAWTLLTLAPVLTIRGVDTNVFAERYLYIPSLGFCLLAATLFAGWTKNLARNKQRWVNGVALALLAVPCFALTAARIPDWKDEYTFYSRTVEASPESGEMHNAFGQILLGRGETDEAARHFNLVLSLETPKQQPDASQIATAYLGLAGVYNARQQFADSLAALDRGLTYDSTIAHLHAARGAVLSLLGRMDEAQDEVLRVSHDYPNDDVVLNAAGLVAFSRKDYETAIGYFRKAVNVLPSSADYHSNLGRAYLGTGRFADAEPEFRDAIRLSPDSASYHNNLGGTLGQMGRLAEAKAEFQKVLALDPQNIHARNNLAIVERVEQEQGASRR